MIATANTKSRTRFRLVEYANYNAVRAKFTYFHMLQVNIEDVINKTLESEPHDHL
jgi:hypothetical protein